MHLPTHATATLAGILFDVFCLLLVVGCIWTHCFTIPYQHIVSVQFAIPICFVPPQCGIVVEEDVEEQGDKMEEEEEDDEKELGKDEGETWSTLNVVG